MYCRANAQSPGTACLETTSPSPPSFHVVIQYEVMTYALGSFLFYISRPYPYAVWFVLNTYKTSSLFKSDNTHTHGNHGRKSFPYYGKEVMEAGWKHKHCNHYLHIILYMMSISNRCHWYQLHCHLSQIIFNFFFKCCIKWPEHCCWHFTAN